MTGDKFLAIDSGGNEIEKAANQSSAGSTDAGKIVALNSNGVLDYTLFGYETTTTSVAVLPAPTGLTANVFGTTASLTYRYVVVANDSNGNSSPASLAVEINNGNDFNFTNYNSISWSPVTGASSYDVYRIYSGSSSSSGVSPGITSISTPGSLLKVSPEGSKLYALSTTNVSDLLLNVIDTNSNQIINSTVLPLHNFLAVDISIDGNNLWVACSNGGIIIDTSTLGIVGTFSNGTGISICPDGSTAYVINNRNVYIYDTSTFALIGSLTLSLGFTQALSIKAISPIRAFIGITDSSNIGNNLAVIDSGVASYYATSSAVGFSHMVLSSDGSVLYNSNRPLAISTDDKYIYANGNFERYTSNFVLSNGYNYFDSSIPSTNFSLNILDVSKFNAYPVLIGKKTLASVPSDLQMSRIKFTIYAVAGSVYDVTVNNIYTTGKIGRTAGTSILDRSLYSDGSLPPSVPTRYITLTTNSTRVQHLDCTLGNIVVNLPNHLVSNNKEFYIDRVDSSAHIGYVVGFSNFQKAYLGKISWAIYNKSNPVNIKSDTLAWKCLSTSIEWGIGQFPKTHRNKDYAGNSFVVMGNDNQLYSWGINTFGNRANNAGNVDIISPVVYDPLNPPADGTYIVDWDNTGHRTFVVFSDGSVYASGSNTYGELGLGTTVASSYLQLITYFKPYLQTNASSLPHVNIVKVWCEDGGTTGSFGSTFFMSSNGDVYACGYNVQGQLGINNSTNTSTPTLVNILRNAVDIKGTYQFNGGWTLACDALGQCWATGYGANMVLGNGISINTTNFGLVIITSSAIGVGGIKKIFPGGGSNGGAGQGCSAALDGAGNLYMCGSNSYAQNGSGTSSATINTMVKVSIPNPIVDFCWGGGYTMFGVALDSYGGVWTWGFNTNNNLFKASTTSPQALSQREFNVFEKKMVATLTTANSAGNFGATFIWEGTKLLYSGPSANYCGIQSVADPSFYASGVFTVFIPEVLRNQSESLVDLFVHNLSTAARVFMLTDRGSLYCVGDNTSQVATGGRASTSNSTSVGPFKIKP